MVLKVLRSWSLERELLVLDTERLQQVEVDSAHASQDLNEGGEEDYNGTTNISHPDF